MNTRMHPTSIIHKDPDETAELPVLDLDAQDAAEVGAAPAVATEIPAGAEAAEEDAARAAEIGSLRTSLATAVETRGQLEGSLQKLTASLRDLEERLHRKSDQLSIFEREVGARDRHIAELEAALTTHTGTAQALQAAHDALAGELRRSEQALAQATEACRRAEAERAALELTRAQIEARIAHAEADAAEHQRRSERYRERLQSREGRRQVFDAMLSEREQLLAESHARIALLESELTERTQHAGARESDLVAELGAEKQRAQLLEDALERARAEVDGLNRRLEQLRADHETRLAAAEQGRRDLERALADAANQAEARTGEIHARLEAEQSRAQELAASLEHLGGERAALEQQHAVARARVVALEAEVQEYGEMVRGTQEQLGAAAGRADTLGADLLAAEDRIRTLEGELRARDATIERLEHAEQEARARIEEVGRSLDERNALISRLEAEAASSAAVLGSIQQNLERLDQETAAPERRPEEGTGETPRPVMADATPPLAAAAAIGSGARQHLPLDQVARLLVRTEGDSGIVHVLGRRTSIGRTADNDLRIEADFISRHHAVVLATTTGTVVEDLHSTNGVFVNGMRVARHRLVEGDLVTIGRTEFRYVTKPIGERPAS